MNLKTFLNSVFLIFLLLNFSFSEELMTKGPAPGEIYFFVPYKNLSTALALCHSWDYGATYTIVDSTSDISRITADADSGGIYYVANGGGLYYSDNFGNIWSYKSFIESEIESGRVSGEIINNAVWYSDNYGSNWIQHNGNGIAGNIGDYEGSSLGNLAGEVYFLSSKGFLFLSPDTGNNFILQSNSNLIEGYVHYLRRGSVTGELYLLNSTTQELLFSQDSGKTFSSKYQFNFQPTYEWFLDMVGSQQQGEVFVLALRNLNMSYYGEFYIYHSNDYGQSWNYYHHVTTGIENRLNPINIFNLSQNYPNPFNGITKIEFCLPFSKNIEISVYNLEGKKIKTLVKKHLSAGNYKIVWNGRNSNDEEVASSVYYYQLTAGNFHETKKLI